MCEDQSIAMGLTTAKKVLKQIRNPDTDGDRILDGIELGVGTDPNEADSDRDPDFDSVINRSEVQGNTDPNSIDGDRFLKGMSATRSPCRRTGHIESRVGRNGAAPLL